MQEHQPVLLKEVIAQLAIKPAGIYIDATFGRGGHAKEILRRLGKNGRLWVIDKDPAAIASALRQGSQDKRLHVYHGSFTALEEITKKNGIYGQVNGILFDLGVSSPQLEQATRGFSFLRDGLLDMRMNPQQGINAAQWLACATEKEIAQVLRDYGEERYANRIAKAIGAARKQEPIVTTVQLATIVKNAHPRWDRHKHPATQTFQAIRICINHELDELQASLAQSVEVLAVGGRLLVISFHSLEDRIVKQFMRKHAREPLALRQLPIMSMWKPRLKTLGRGIKPDAQAIAVNPRSRSARLRVAEKLS
jgi:16S rRNA (cytosine1402-N4)-methyltransferase